MKKYSLLVLFLGMLFIFPMKTHAACSYADKTRLQRIATNVNFSYDFVENNNKVEFQIRAVNLHPDLYIVDTSNKKNYYYYQTGNDYVFSSYQPDQVIQYQFYSSSSTCSGQVLFSNYVTLPPYNDFYGEKVCIGAEEYKLCQKWVRHDLAYWKFFDQVSAYKNKKNQKPDMTEKEKQEKNLTERYEAIIAFWADYYLFILGGIIIVSVALIYYIDKKSDL